MQHPYAGKSEYRRHTEMGYGGQVEKDGAQIAYGYSDKRHYPSEALVTEKFGNAIGKDKPAAVKKNGAAGVI